MNIPLEEWFIWFDIQIKEKGWPIGYAGAVSEYYWLSEKEW